MRTCCRTQGTLVNVRRWPESEGSPEGQDICICMADSFCCAVEPNITSYTLIKINIKYKIIEFLNTIQWLRQHTGKNFSKNIADKNSVINKCNLINTYRTHTQWLKNAYCFQAPLKHLQKLTIH